MEIPDSPHLPAYPMQDPPAEMYPLLKLGSLNTALELGRFPIVPLKPCNCPLCQPRLVMEAPTVVSFVEVTTALKAYHCPGSSTLKRCKGNWAFKGCPPFLSVNIRHGSGKGQNFPSWCLSYWEMISRYWKDIKWWRLAVQTLEGESNEAGLQLLAQVTWHSAPQIRGFVVSDLAPFATNAWLSDSQVDLLAWWINRELVNTKSILLEIPHVMKMLEIYSSCKEDITRLPHSCPRLHEVLEEFKAGELDKIGICLHVLSGMGLPIDGRQGNHWVAVVIDRKACVLRYGDSLGYPPHDSVVNFFTWWMNPLLSEQLTVEILPHSVQPGGWSCGDYAFNMIAHHFDQHRFPLVGLTTTDAIAYRRHLLHILVEAMNVG